MPKVVGIENGSYSDSDSVETSKGISFVKKEFSLTYLVLSDTLDDDSDDIKATTGIPPLFYPLYGALCKSRSAKEETRIIHPTTGVPAILWSVTCNFDSSLDEQDGENSGTPELQTPRVSWGGENEDEATFFDTLTGKAIVNACDEPIFLSRPTCYPILTIKRYELYPFDPLVMIDYVNTINETVFWGAPRGTALMMPMEISEMTVINNRRYVDTTYRIKFRIDRTEDGTIVEDAWKFRMPHQGCKYRPTASDAPVVARKNGQPVIVNLKVDGTKLADGEDIETISFNRFYYTEFNNLSLGPF